MYVDATTNEFHISTVVLDMGGMLVYLIWLHWVELLGYFFLCFSYGDVCVLGHISCEIVSVRTRRGISGEL